ncbi:MAG: hypothetical protein WAM14_07090 [Candidatus Nitrosopolaris sp.]
MIVGLIFNPVFIAHVAQATTTGNTKKVLLVASEKVVQVAPDDTLHPSGIKYNAMVFNGTILAHLLHSHKKITYKSH